MALGQTHVPDLPYMPSRPSPPPTLFCKATEAGKRAGKGKATSTAIRLLRFLTTTHLGRHHARVEDLDGGLGGGHGAGWVSLGRWVPVDARWVPVDVSVSSAAG